MRRELKWLGGALGTVRDLDVLVEHLTAEVESLGGDQVPRRKLLRTLERSRRTARRKLVALLDSDRYFALLDTLEQPVATIADTPTLEEIHAAEHKRLRKAVKTLDDASADQELHAVRIHVKRARYAAELAGCRRLRHGGEGAAGCARRASGCSRRGRAAARPRDADAGCRPLRPAGCIEREHVRALGDAASGGRRGRSSAKTA